jgi:uncharacterized protein (DUF2062 family)
MTDGVEHKSANSDTGLIEDMTRDTAGVTRKKNFLVRVITKEVVDPIRHATDHPDRVARGILVGTFVSVTPTFGIQMPIVSIIWLLFKPFKKLNFNLPLGLAMTWLTNYVTFLPYYFLIYMLGSLFLDIFMNVKTPMDYQQFSALWQPLLSAGFWDSFVNLMNILAMVGVRMLLGAIPFFITLPPLLYFLTLRYQKKLKNR